MDLHPRNRRIVRRAVANRRQAVIRRQHLVVAIHAHASAGNVRIPRLFHIVMAIPAINPKLISMNGMREEDRLHRLITNIGVFWREIIRDTNHSGRAEQREPNQNPARQLVRPLWKNVRHFIANRQARLQSAGSSPILFPDSLD